MIQECLFDPNNQWVFDIYNYRDVLSRASMVLHRGSTRSLNAKYAYTGAGNRMTTVQKDRLLDFIRSVLPLYKKSSPQAHRVLNGALRKLERA